MKPENIQLALVVHGSASVDLLKTGAYKQRFNSDNKNQQLISQLLAHNTVVYVCGQSATHMQVKQEQLIPVCKWHYLPCSARTTTTGLYPESILMNILCFGDSNTYGISPLDGKRFDEHTRWPCLLADKLGAGHLVIEAGLQIVR